MTRPLRRPLPFKKTRSRGARALYALPNKQLCKGTKLSRFVHGAIRRVRPPEVESLGY